MLVVRILTINGSLICELFQQTYNQPHERNFRISDKNFSSFHFIFCWVYQFIQFSSQQINQTALHIGQTDRKTMLSTANKISCDIIVDKVKWFKPIRSLYYIFIFGLNGSQHLRATNKNVALIYSVTINEKTTKDYSPSGCKDPYIY